jgi:hypothetical protein
MRNSDFLNQNLIYIFQRSYKLGGNANMILLNGKHNDKQASNQQYISQTLLLQSYLVGLL